MVSLRLVLLWNWGEFFFVCFKSWTSVKDWRHTRPEWVSSSEKLENFLTQKPKKNKHKPPKQTKNIANGDQVNRNTFVFCYSGAVSPFTVKTCWIWSRLKWNILCMKAFNSPRCVAFLTDLNRGGIKRMTKIGCNAQWN